MIKVILNDSKIPYANVYAHFSWIAGWAKANCPSYVTYETIDVSDFSVTNDVLAEYTFVDERDATLFRLKWS
jgi:hypothetical protein